MQTIQQAHAHGGAYFGERGDWLIAAVTHRDADTLTRANFDELAERLEAAGCKPEREESGHWAVGWVLYLIIDPADALAVEIAEEAARKLADYPVLNDERWSEYEEAAYLENVAEEVGYWCHRHGIPADVRDAIAGRVALNVFASGRDYTEETYPDDSEIFWAAVEIRREIGHPLDDAA